MFHGNYGPILYHFQDKVRCWSKIAIISYPTGNRRPPLGEGVLEYRTCKYCHYVWYERTRMMWLCDYQMVKKCENKFICFDTIQEEPDVQRHHMMAQAVLCTVSCSNKMRVNYMVDSQQWYLYSPNKDMYSTVYSARSAKPDRSAAQPRCKPSVSTVWQKHNLVMLATLSYL